MLFARSGTISKGLLPFPRTPSTRCALENLKINQVNLTWSGFKHPRFRRVSIDFLHIILDLFLGRIPRLGLSTSANTTLQKKMAIFCWDQCLGKRFTLRFSTISKKSLPKEIWTDYKNIYIYVLKNHTFPVLTQRFFITARLLPDDSRLASERPSVPCGSTAR